MKKETFSELLAMRVRGALAKAFMLRRVEPTTEQWVQLYAVTEMTMRDISDMCHALDVEPSFCLQDITPEREVTE